MEWNQLLAFAAEDLAVAQGKTTQTGHTGPDGSTMKTRIEKYGSWTKTIGENIAYRSWSAKSVVLQLFIDDGVPDRGHRANIMKPEFLSLGAWRSTHKTQVRETVMDYAGGMKTNGNKALVKNYECKKSTGYTWKKLPYSKPCPDSAAGKAEAAAAKAAAAKAKAKTAATGAPDSK